MIATQSDAAICSFSLRTITASSSGGSSATTTGFSPSACARAKAAPISHPSVALLPRPPKHQRFRPSPVDKRALLLLDRQMAILRLQHLIGGPGLQIGRASASDRRHQTVLAQGIADGRQRSVRNRFQFACRWRRLRYRSALLGRIRHHAAPRVGGCGINRTIGVLNQPPDFLGFLDRTPRQPDMGGILALRLTFHFVFRL